MSSNRNKKKTNNNTTYKASSLSVGITESNSNSSANSRSNSPSKSNRKKKTKHKSCKKPKDKHKPKQSQSSFFLFCNEVRPSLQQQHSDKSFTEIAKLIGSQWKQLSIHQKKPYIDKAKLLRDEYNRTLTEYKQSKHYKVFQQTLKEWQQNENANKNKKNRTQKSKKKKHKKKKSKSKKIAKSRSHKRKRKKKEINYSSESSLSSLSSILCDNPQPPKPKSPHKKRRKKSKNKKHSSDDLSSDVDSENRKYLSIADAVRNTTFGIEMPSKIRERAQKIRQSNNRNESNTVENESEEKKQDIFSCGMCEKRCLSLNELLSHEKKLHTNQCKQCALRFRTVNLLQQHVFDKHDLFSENINDSLMRVDENGNFMLNQSISTQRFVYQNSRWKQTERVQYKINQITDTKVVDANVDNNKEKRLKTRVTAHSFIKKKRHNISNTAQWSMAETERFYQVLSYTALNFVFMEVLYNKATTKQEDKVKIEIKEDKDDKDDKDDNESVVESVCEDKKILKWRYKDAKALKAKYYREEKTNKERITSIIRNVKFEMDTSDVIEALVKKNDFKLKDEDYFKDSDVETVEDVGDVEIVDEDIFNPLIAFKDEIECDKESEREAKKKKMEKLEGFRKERDESMANALAKFKKEQQEYKKYKKIKEQSVTPIATPTPSIKMDENVPNNMEINAENGVDEDVDGDSSDFDPFGILADKNDSDCGVDGYESHHSDRSVTKNKKYNNNNNNGGNVYENDGGDEYDDYNEYNGYDDGQGFDIDGDPFA